MDKLILFNEIKKEKKKSRLFTFSKVDKNKEDYNKSYISFEEKYNCLQYKEEFNNLKNGNNENINEVIGRIFSSSNNSMLINFINSIYDDELDLNTKIKSVNYGAAASKSCNYNAIIFAQDEYRKFEYTIQFETADNQNMGIVINKVTFNSNDKNIINLNMKRKKYEKQDGNTLKESFDKCLIVLDSNIQVPDGYKFKSNTDGKDVRVNIIKGWKYGFKQLFEKNMYLLFPLKVVDLKKRLLDINTDLVSKDLIRNEILVFFREMNRYLNKIKAISLITDKDINEINLIAIDLLINLINESSSIFVDIKTDIETTLKEIVV